MLAFVSFLLGLVIGGLLGTIIAHNIVKKNIEEKVQIISKEMTNLLDTGREELAKSSKNLELLGSLKYRLKKIAEITEQQHILTNSLDMPSKNPTHSKHKNGLIASIKDLEHEKMRILKSILDDGVDSNIKILTNEGEKVMKISEAIKRYENLNNIAPLPTKVSDETTDTSSKGRVLQLIKPKGDSDE